MYLARAARSSSELCGDSGDGVEDVIFVLVSSSVLSAFALLGTVFEGWVGDVMCFGSVG